MMSIAWIFHGWAAADRANRAIAVPGKDRPGCGGSVLRVQVLLGRKRLSASLVAVKGNRMLASLASLRWSEIVAPIMADNYTQVAGV